MNLSNLSVKAKLGAGFGLLALVVTCVSAMSLRSLEASHDDFQTYVEDDAARISLANDVLDAANARAIGARNLVLVGAADRDAEKAAVGQAHAKLQDTIAKLKASLAKAGAAHEQEKKIFAELERAEAKYGPVALGIVELALVGKRDEAVGRMNAECRPLLAVLLQAANAYIGEANGAAAKAVKESEASFASARNTLLAICAASLGAATILAVGITRSLTRALGAEPADLGRTAERVAAGDLNPVAGAAHAPKGSVLASLADMQTSLARVVGQVRAASDSIATGSAQIATGNADLSQRTEEQASNLQQTAASMEQLNSTVKNNADTARQATQMATSASAVARKGGEVVGQVVTTMDDISAASKRIADIIGVIDGIAFQTNILALNAAVEAARAGEQGRGFAVVASEVRSLAQRSAEAAREIKSLIGDSVAKVENGAHLVADAGATMTDVVNQVQRVADLIGEISSSALEQTSGIGQVNDAVTQLDQVTQQNAALVEESAAAADSLQQQAARLAEMVQVFKLAPGMAHA
ncbi:MAG TPA: methyl-accepting chemotaxis protein [Piscinibacter sp.]|nr:methyl-accepting chemotaxis protein [Piscinibacter sp.]